VQKFAPKLCQLGEKSGANCHPKRVQKQGKFLAFCCMFNHHNPLIYKNLGVVKQKRQGIVHRELLPHNERSLAVELNKYYLIVA